MRKRGFGRGRPPETGRATKSSGRYTPPTPRYERVSPSWVPVFMMTTLVCGAVIIMTGYFGLRPGGAQLAMLLVGSGFVAAGLLAATRYR